MSSPLKKTGMNRWKRLTRKLNAERVDNASVFALSKTLPAGNSDFSRRPWDQAIDLEAFAHIKDYDEVYAEAQELVNDWLNTKLKQELASDGEDDTKDTMSSFSSATEAKDHMKYDKFDDLCDYLEEEEESVTVRKFIDHLLHKDVVDSEMLGDLGVKRNQDKKQQKDPRPTMEMRHKQVKENRLRREKELEHRRIEKSQKISAFLEAQYLVQEEKKRKALEAKKEKEEIQKEMVKLRREIIERKHTVEETWRIEKKKLKEESSQHPEKGLSQSTHVILSEEKKITKERKKKLQVLLIQTFKEDHQCQKRYFSAWHKLILDHRIKLGKAGVLSDWKLQLKVLHAWRDYTRSQKLERETQAMENDLREENRKQQLAKEHNRKQVLRHHFTEWQHWHHAEVRKREMIRAKEETRRKMNELLKAASEGKLGAKPSSGICETEETTTAVDTSMGNGEVIVIPPLWEKCPLQNNACMPSPPEERATKNKLQVPLQNFSINSDQKQHKTLDGEISNQPGHREKFRTTRQKTEPICMDHLKNRQVFQQRLIEKQKKKLQEQQKTIQKLKESHKLAEAQWALEHAIIIDAQNHLLSNIKEESRRTYQVLPNSPATSSEIEGSRSDSQNCLSESRRNPRQSMAPHPLLKAMEERAIQRAERRRILAERKKKQEEKKLAQLKAQEEEHQKREAEEKEAQIKKRQEEKRLKKMKELEKQKRTERNQQLTAIAKAHYEKILLRKKGLEPWKRLRAQSKQNMQVAREHHFLTLKKKCLLTWFQCSQESLARKKALANQFHSQKLLRRVIHSWIQHLTYLEEAVQKFHVHFLQKKIFRAWLNMVRESKTDFQSKQEIAVEHSNRRIIWSTFQTWKAFAKFMQEERVKEERRELLRRKVAEILPDFQKLAPP